MLMLRRTYAPVACVAKLAFRIRENEAWQSRSPWEAATNL
jgi:hypothetical protein